MGKKKLDPAALAEAFRNFQNTPECDLWNRLSAKIRKHEDIEDLETGTTDISGNWQPFLDNWYQLVCALKIPKKSKSYDQEYFRTMFFSRDDSITIDGVTFEISNAIKVDTWTSKQLVVIDVFESFKDADTIEESNYMDLKKKLVNQLKAFEKQYQKHVKKTHPEVYHIILTAITPLMNLLESNYNFYKLEELKRKKAEIPPFRYKALEDKFCEHLEFICTVLKEHGELKDTFAIKRMLNLLKLENWEKNVPMAFYLSPLKDSIKAMRDELIRMRKLGENRCKYFIEQNENMHKLIINMVSKDVTAQWLMGNKLKNDQLCFLYDVIKIIYKSPLKAKLINFDKELIEIVIPEMAVFRALLIIRDILQVKFDENKKAKELAFGKRGTDAILVVEDEKDNQDLEFSEELDVDDPKATEEVKEYRRKKREEEIEMKKYGRMWVWETYISENRKNDWKEIAEIMRNINEHVIQDIQDSILIHGFKKQQQTNRKLIDEKVDYLLEFHEKSTSKEDKVAIQEKKKKRKFEQALRPPFVWNFFETRADKEEKSKMKAPGEEVKDEEEEEERKEKAPYLINAFAQPEKCYVYEEKIKENRVKKIQK